MSYLSCEEDITDSQLENGALDCGRFTLPLQRSSLEGRRLSRREPFVWIPPERGRHLDGGLFLTLDEVCRQLTGLDRYVPLVIFLMAETGLPIEELCAVKWEGV